MTEAEFTERFVAQMLKRAGPKFNDGSSNEEYARATAPSYFEEQHQQDGESPEDCADADMSYWGEE